MESDSEFESESEYESDSSLEFSARPSQPNEPLKFSQLFRWVLILILTWHIAHSISATAINEMLQFLAAAFSVTEGLVSCSAAVGLSAFPASLYLAYKFLSVDTDNFSKYVLCPKCHRLYDFTKKCCSQTQMDRYKKSKTQMWYTYCTTNQSFRWV